MSKFKREISTGLAEYSDGTYWFDERNVCQHCLEEREAAGKPFRWADERHSFGIYAGRWCDQCWPKSGYADVREYHSVFELHVFEAGGWTDQV